MVTGEIPVPRLRDPRMKHTLLAPLHAQAGRGLQKGNQLATRETGQVLVGLLELADRMRRSGGGDRNLLHWAINEQMQLGLITIDDQAVIYRHMAIHAGMIKPCQLERFRVCPVCEAYLDVPEGDEAA